MIDNTVFFLILSPFALLVLGVIVYSIVFLWQLRHYPLEKAREMATGAKDGMIFFTALLALNLLCGVILRPIILQRYSADALTFGLLTVDFIFGYIILAIFARIWIAKRRVRQLEVQSQERSF
jgi:hypothetical protein